MRKGMILLQSLAIAALSVLLILAFSGCREPL
jgi:hypothetical protein